MNEHGVIKVLIHTLDGRYLAREGEAWRLARACSKAALFDFPAAGFADQLKGSPSAYGAMFIVVPFDALKAHEIWDGCGRMVRPLQAFFDGKQFFCPECRTAPVRPHPPVALKRDSSWQSSN